VPNKTASAADTVYQLEKQRKILLSTNSAMNIREVGQEASLTPDNAAMKSREPIQISITSVTPTKNEFYAHNNRTMVGPLRASGNATNHTEMRHTRDSDHGYSLVTLADASTVQHGSTMLRHAIYDRDDVAVGQSPGGDMSKRDIPVQTLNRSALAKIVLDPLTLPEIK
jgi:hypothetical protein